MRNHFMHTFPVLPTTYDDALSYSELIRKLSVAVNALAELVDGYTNGELLKFIEENTEQILGDIGLLISYNEDTNSLVIDWEVGEHE